MGFSKQDLEGQQGLPINLDRIRSGHRVQSRERLNFPFQGIRSEFSPKRKSPDKERRQDDLPSYDALYQRRLW